MFPYYLLKSTTTLGVRYRIRVRIREWLGPVILRTSDQ